MNVARRLETIRVDVSQISEEAGDHPSAEAISAALDTIGPKQSAARAAVRINSAWPLLQSD